MKKKRGREKVVKKKINKLSIAIALFISAVVGGIGSVIYIDLHYRSLSPDITVLKEYQKQLWRNGTVYCKNTSNDSTKKGKVIVRIPPIRGEKNGKPIFDALVEPVTIGEIPPIMLWATLAAEDRDFLTHSGVNYRALVRVTSHNIKTVVTGKRKQGGSTIPMQLVKLVYFTSDGLQQGMIPDGTSDLGRKFFEWVLAREFVDRLGREHLLEMYHNLASYGGRNGENVKGVRAAMRIWFGDKPLSKLSTTDAAFLASLYKAPNNLFNNPERPNWPIERRNYVLDGLAQMGVISTSSAAELKTRPLGISKKPGNQATDNTGFLADHIRMQLIERFGKDAVTKSGAEFETTFDCELQKMAEEALREGLAKAEEEFGLSREKRLEGAMIVLDLESEMLAMVGGREERAAGNINLAIRPRQVGSTMKPMVYSIAYEHLELWDTFPPTCLDVRRSYRIAQSNPPRNWAPKNFKDSYRGGYISITQGLIDSSNTCTADLAWRVGTIEHREELLETETSTRTIYLEPVIEMARRFQYPTRIKPYEPAKIIGAGEATVIQMAAIYGVFARDDGMRYEPRWIEKAVIDGEDKTPARKDPTPVLSQRTAYFMRENLKQVARPIQKAIPSEVGGKTGSVNESRVVWFCGFTPTLVACVLAAYNDNSPLPQNAVGGKVARPIFVAFMKKALGLARYATPATFSEELPPGVELRYVDGSTIAVPTQLAATSTVIQDTVGDDGDILVTE